MVSPRSILSSLTALALIAPQSDRVQQPSAAPKLDMTPVLPESVGFSSDRLDRLHAFVQGHVDRKQLAGAVTQTLLGWSKNSGS